MLPCLKVEYEPLDDVNPIDDLKYLSLRLDRLSEYCCRCEESISDDSIISSITDELASVISVCNLSASLGGFIILAGSAVGWMNGELNFAPLWRVESLLIVEPNEEGYPWLVELTYDSVCSDSILASIFSVGEKSCIFLKITAAGGSYSISLIALPPPSDIFEE